MKTANGRLHCARILTGSAHQQENLTKRLGPAPAQVDTCPYQPRIILPYPVATSDCRGIRFFFCEVDWF